MHFTTAIGEAFQLALRECCFWCDVFFLGTAMTYLCFLHIFKIFKDLILSLTLCRNHPLKTESLSSSSAGQPA
jgi:hypothetical protein